VTDHVDLSGMTDAEKADLYAKQVQDMRDRQPTGQDSGDTTAR